MIVFWAATNFTTVKYFSKQTLGYRKIETIITDSLENKCELTVHLYFLCHVARTILQGKFIATDIFIINQERLKMHKPICQSKSFKKNKKTSMMTTGVRT